MALQLSVAVRDARLDAIQTAMGTSAIIEIWSGSMPANCAAGTTGTKLVEYALASSYFGSASAGAKTLSSLPITGTGLANGTAGYFRMFASDDATCHMQGTITVTGGGGDMTLDNTAINSGQSVNLTGFTLTDANS